MLGIIISVVFGVYNKTTATPYIRNLFGVSTTDLISGSLIAVIIGGFVLLAVFSAIIRDVSYPINHPVKFTVETLLMAFTPAAIFLVSTILRGYKLNTDILGSSGILVLQSGLLNILLQFSGFHSYVFSR
jgi:hypothetical protein